jgi:hypothetical protein
MTSNAGTITAAPPRPETWLARAREVGGDLLLAGLLVTGVPLAVVIVTMPVIWLVRTLVATLAGS